MGEETYIVGMNDTCTCRYRNINKEVLIILIIITYKGHCMGLLDLFDTPILAVHWVLTSCCIHGNAELTRTDYYGNNRKTGNQ